MNLKLRRFMHALTGEQQERFAGFAGTTVGTLRHLVTERRHASSATAIALEKAAARMERVRGIGPLPDLSRGDLNSACHGCEFRKACTRPAPEPLDMETLD